MIVRIVDCQARVYDLVIPQRAYQFELHIYRGTKRRVTYPRFVSAFIVILSYRRTTMTISPSILVRFSESVTRNAQT